MSRSALASAITLRSLTADKGLSRLGDSITNLVLSLAISLVLRKPEGIRASDKVLSQALNEAGLRHIAPRRAGSDQLGDLTEAIIATGWLNKIIDIEDAAATIATEFKEDDFHDRKRYNLSAIRGFKRLLEKIMQNLDVQSLGANSRVN